MKMVILLVEDEFLLREVTKGDLADLGYCTVCAKDAEEAFQALESDERIGIMITDIRMPGNWDGWELARRARVLRPDLSVIYVSGYSADEPQPVPGSIFIKKPYRLEEIERALAQFGLPYC
jgi:CheY-like chemotaxis protein